MAERFVEMRMRRELKVIADKSKVMVLCKQGGSLIEVLVDWTRLEQVLEFK